MDYLTSTTGTPCAAVPWWCRVASWCRAFNVARMAVCDFCKGDIASDATKCPHCGEWVGGRDPSKPSHAFTLLAVTVITLVVMMLVLGII